MAPIILGAKHRSSVSHYLVATGQQDSLFDKATTDFGLCVDHYLGRHLGTLGIENQIGAMRKAIGDMLLEQRPDLVLVQGDTNSAYAAALAADDKNIAVGHVEAGLRSHIVDRPWPEERNRLAIGQIAVLHFAPSQCALDNLIQEKAPGIAVLTGNPGIDALMMIASPPPVSKQISDQAINHILVTCHRRENFGAPLLNICRALNSIAERHDVIINMPLHSNSQVRLKVTAELGKNPRIRLVDPLGYHDMITAVRSVRLVISDSGGLQEECAALGVPLILMRDETERPEVVASQNCILTGADPQRIIAETSRLLDDPVHHARMSQPIFPYGQGNAAKHILDAIELIGRSSSLRFGSAFDM